MKYKKKLEVVEAVQWLGDNIDDLETFVGSAMQHTTEEDGRIIVSVTTFKGPVRVDEGDYVVQVPGTQHFYPCRSSLFESNYEPLED